MISPPSRPVSLCLAASLLLAGCADGSGPTWTYAPPSAEPSALPTGEPSSPAPSVPSTIEPTAEATAVPSEAGSATPTGEPSSPAPSEPTEARVIELEATNAIRFVQDGAQLTDIPVRPGETVRFRVDNTAGFPHNFMIGTDAQLSSAASGLPGIPDWSQGVQELEWTVAADIGGLKFGCTVPGHYSLMQGTFSVQE
jgi:hypothetical protein